MVALKLTKALREALQRAEAWPAEAQNELARLALEIEAGVRGRPIHVSYAGPAEAPKSFAVRGSYKSKEYKYPVSEELSPPEFFRKLSAASQLGTGTFMAVYAANIKTVRALHVNPMLRRGRINSANCQEALDLTKVSAVLHDVSFVNLTGAESFAMLSVSEVAGSETEISVGLSKTLPQAIFEQISQSDSLCLYYLMRHDDSTEALLRDLAPFIERGRVVVEPERSVFYAVAHDENGKLVYHTIKVPPDSPANEWNVHFTEPSVQEQDTQTTRQNFQDEKLLFDVVVPYVEGIGNADLAKILDDENEVLVEFRSSIRTLISQAKQDQGKIDQILNDVVRPKVAMLDRQFRRITNMNRLKIGGAAVSTATIGLVSYLTTGVAAGITAVAGVSGLVYLTKEMAGGISDLSALKDDPASYLLWKLKRFQAGKD